MVIKYGNDKDVKCYRDFVQHPEDRSSMRAFSKTFGQPLMEPAIKLHERLEKFDSAADYNAVYGSTDNRIELKQGDAGNSPLTLKVRVGRGPRKFFHQLLDNGELLLRKQWKGDFQSVTVIFVFAITNHDYKV
jgi:hypothetical protein